MAHDVARRRAHRRLPARAVLRAARGVEAAPVDRHEGVAAVRVDRDPAALAGAAPAHQRARVERARAGPRRRAGRTRRCPSSRSRCPRTARARRRSGRACRRSRWPPRRRAARAAAARRVSARPGAAARAAAPGGCRRGPAPTTSPGPTRPSGVEAALALEAAHGAWMCRDRRRRPARCPGAAGATLTDALGRAAPPRCPAWARRVRRSMRQVAGADDAVGLDVVAALEAAHGARGALAEDSVGGQAELRAEGA